MSAPDGLVIAVPDALVDELVERVAVDAGMGEAGFFDDLLAS